MVRKVEVKIVGKYNGHSVKANQSVDLSFKVGYDQLSNSVMLLQMLNNDVEIQAKITNEKPFKLGTFRVQEVKVSHDGESVLKFNSMTDFTEVGNFTRLFSNDLVVLRVIADVEIEDEEEGE